jgi:hypothetical protein
VPYMLVPCQQFVQEAIICQYATNSDEPVVMLDHSLAIHTGRLEKRLLLSLLSIESSPGSEEGGSDQQMTPEILNEIISAKFKQ